MFGSAEAGVSAPGRWSEETGFLTGAAGIALALLAALTTVEPEWDRVMLLSFPDGGEESRAHHDSDQ